MSPTVYCNFARHISLNFEKSSSEHNCMIWIYFPSAHTVIPPRNAHRLQTKYSHSNNFVESYFVRMLHISPATWDNVKAGSLVYNPLNTFKSILRNLHFSSSIPILPEASHVLRNSLFQCFSNFNFQFMPGLKPHDPSSMQLL